MALFQTKPEPAKEFITYGNRVAAKIQQRRYQILVHSLLYYELDMNLVSDSLWSAWAIELAELQRQHPDIADKVIFADAFKDFDSSSGFDLPYRDEQIVNIAYRLLGAHPEVRDQLYRVRTTPAEYESYSRKNKPKPTIQRKAGNKVEPGKRKKLF